jgi:HEAT repeat protein
VLPAVVTAAKSSEKDVRVAALKALGALGNASVVPVLTEASLASDADVAQTAQATLAGLPGKDVDNAVVALLDSKDAKTRELALDMAGRRHAASAVPVLLKAADGPDAAGRVGAIKALGEVATANDMPALIKLLTSAKSPAEAGAAEKSLSAVCARATNRDACADALVAPIAGATPDTKRALLRLLCSVGGAKALQSLRTAASDADTETRDAATRALCEWPDLDAAGDLLNLAKTGATPTYKLLGIRGYLRLAANADVQPPQKLDMCKQAAELIQRDDEKRLLLGVLGGVPTGPSLQMVATYLDNPGTKEEAATAAVAIVERMSRGRNAGPLPPVAGDVMEKVAKVSGNAELVKKATAFAKRAQRKAPAKKK